MLRVSHVITGLGVGGAEMMLVKLLGGLDPKQFRSHVISLSSDLALAPAVREMGIPIDVLDVAPYAASVLPAVVRMRRLLRAAQPDLVQTWLYHADLAGGLAAKWLGLPVIWNVQTSTVDPKGISRRTIRVVKLCAKTSGFLPDTIVSCSQAAVGIHTALGYRDKFRVIPNGTDIGIFRADEDVRRAVRAELNVDDATPVIGMAARFHAQKDHPNFLAAAADLVRTHPRVRFALCGLGLQPDNEELMSIVRGHGLQTHVLLMGLRRDIPRVLNAFDIHALSSAFGEGFPNVLGEAMATGVPCVVTDIGDSAMIVGDTGVAVPARDPSALANGWRRLLDLSTEEFATLRVRARQRVVTEFSLAASVRQYAALYEACAQGRMGSQ
jgi:glycosyltransferase involved in cell wall biosynthesis